MDIDAAAKERFASEAERMQPKHLDLGAVVGRGRRMRATRRMVSAIAVAASLAAILLVGTQLWEGGRQSGETIPELVAPMAQNAALDAEATETVKRFISALDDPDERRSWELLAPGTQDRIGSMARWAQQRGKVSSFLSWVAAPDVDLVLTRFPPVSGERFVATAVAPPADGRALLQPIPLVHNGSGFLVELASTDFVHSISLEPLTPRFESGCAGEGCSDGLPEWSQISDGDLFRVALEPGEKVADVWFAVGSEWIADAELTLSDGQAIAEATFEAGEVEPGEKVFLVAIRTDETFEAYGYRVTYERE